MEISTIGWHEECLKNMKISLLEQKKRFVILQEEIERATERVDFYNEQVRSARIAGKPKFDRDRYKVPRNKKR